MATNTTFTTLQSDVQTYLERGGSAASDPTVFAQIPRLINLAERNIARELKVQGFIEPVTTTLVAGTSVYAKPDRWRDTVSLNIGVGATNTQRKSLLPRSYEYVRSYWPDESEQAEPLFYADYGADHWLIGPTPADAYPMEANCYLLPALLDDANQTNWLTEEAPQLLLYGTLLQAAPFLKNDDRIGTWRDFYDRAAQSLVGEDLAKILDRAAQRTEA